LLKIHPTWSLIIVSLTNKIIPGENAGYYFVNNNKVWKQALTNKAFTLNKY